MRDPGIEQSMLAPIPSSTRNLPESQEIIVGPTWKLSEKATAAMEYLQQQPTSISMNMSARAPIICRGSDCPYVATCELIDKLRPLGEPCPIEIQAVTNLTATYCAELKITLENMIDYTLVRDLVDIDIIIARARGILASDPNIIKDVVAAVDNRGNVHTKPEIHKAIDIISNLLKERRSIISELNASRKSKAQTKQVVTNDASSRAAAMREKIKAYRAAEKPEIIDAEFREK